MTHESERAMGVDIFQVFQLLYNTYMCGMLLGAGWLFLAELRK